MKDGLPPLAPSRPLNEEFEGEENDLKTDLDVDVEEERHTSETPEEVDEGGVRIVGITAPTKEDWSDEFDLGDGSFLGLSKGNDASQFTSVLENVGDVENSNPRRGSIGVFSMPQRAHSTRSIVRSLDWAKLQAMHQQQRSKKTLLQEDLGVLEEVRQSSRSVSTAGSGSNSSSNQSSGGIMRERHSAGGFEGTGSKAVARRTQSVGVDSANSGKTNSLPRDGIPSEKDAPFEQSSLSYDERDSTNDAHAARRARRQQVAKTQLHRLSISKDESFRESLTSQNNFSSPVEPEEEGFKTGNVLYRLKNKFLMRSAIAGDEGNNDGENELDLSIQETDYDMPDESDTKTPLSPDDMASFKELARSPPGERSEEELTIIHDDDDVGDDEGSSLSSGSDWDAMLAAEEEEQKSPRPSDPKASSTLGAFQQHLEGMRSLVEKMQNDHKEAQIPKRWRFTSQLNEDTQAPTVVRYPKPTALYSLRTKEGNRFMQETALEKWLSNLVSVEQVEFRKRETARIVGAMEQDIKNVRKTLSQAIPGSAEWSENYLSFIWSLFAARQDGMCAENATRLFRVLGGLANERRRQIKKHSFSSNNDGSGRESIFEAQSPSRHGARKLLSRPAPQSPQHHQTTSRKKNKSHRSKSVDDLESEKSVDSDSASICAELREPPWDEFLLSIITTLQLGVLALARSGTAHAQGDLSRGRGVSKESIPRSIFTMVNETKKWISSRVPENLNDFVDTSVQILEAESAAHQLATRILDFKELELRYVSSSGTLQEVPISSKASSKGRKKKTSKDSTSLKVPEELLESDERRCWAFAYDIPKSSATPFLSKEAQLAESVLGQFCFAYLRMKDRDLLNVEDDLGQYSRAHPQMLQAASLCDVQLLLSGMSPLTSNETNKLQDALDQLQLELEDWMTSDERIEVEIVEIVNKCRSRSGANGREAYEEGGISMCIGIVHAAYVSSATMDEEMVDILECELLCNVDPAYRMNVLQKLYEDIPSSSMVKAKAAYVLSMYFWDEQRDSARAEELLFECLFVLESLKDQIHQCKGASLLSELATNAMVLFGDVLVHNGKYKYAIGAYESATRSYNIREHESFKWLHRRLCNICVVHLDWDRALKFHLEILHATKLETNLNEFVYVSERVAMMLLDQKADFAQAESHLKLALSYLSKSQSSSGDGDLSPSRESRQPGNLPSLSDAHNRSLRVKLQQRLAHVLLAANRPEDAARLLSRVLGVVQSGRSLGADEVSPYLGWPSQNPSMSQDHPLNDTFSAEHLQTSSSRLVVLLLLARCALKLRWLADCTVALDQLAQEVSHGRWCDPTFADGHINQFKDVAQPRPRPTPGMICEILTLLAGTSAEITMSYATIRARCTLYQGFASEAVVWLDETLKLAGVDPNSKSSTGAASSSLHDAKRRDPSESCIISLTLGQIARLYYYRGKVMQLMQFPVVMQQIDSSIRQEKSEFLPVCQECGRSIRSEHQRRSTGAGEMYTIRDAFAEDRIHGFLESALTDISFDLSEESVRSFWCAFEYFQLIDDALWQAKTLARISQVQLVSLKESRNDAETRVEALARVEETTTMALDLCADLGYAPLMLRCLLNMAELQALRKDWTISLQFAHETSVLLNSMYLTTQISGRVYSDGSSPGSKEPTEVDAVLPTASFSFGETQANARMEMEEALSNFINLSSHEEGIPQNARHRRGSVEPEAVGAGEFNFPPTRVPGFHTTPSLTYRILEHLSRLLRLYGFYSLEVHASSDANEKNLDLLIEEHLESILSWNWITDECWKQYAYAAKIVLPEHARSPIYELYLANYIKTLRKKASEDFMNNEKRSESAEASRSEIPPRHAHHQRNKSDSAVPSSSASSSKNSKEKSLYQGRQRERIRQLKQQILTVEEGCKRCKLSRQAEMMTTEGRTNSTLWSCFHQLKLYAHGDIGQSLHMTEVFSKSMELLRKIRRLTRASQGAAPAATLIFGSTPKSVDVAHQPRNIKIFRNPGEADLTQKAKTMASQIPLALFCGWEEELFSVSNAARRRPEPVRILYDAKNHLELDQKTLFEACREQGFDDDGVEMYKDPVATLYGLFDIMKGLSIEDCFAVVSVVLSEKQVIIASSQCHVRARAIEAILALIRPFKWIHFLTRNLPAACAFATGRLLRGEPYIVGIHPAGVADFINGVYTGCSLVDDEVFLPLVINIDDMWLDLPKATLRQSPLIPAPLRALLVRRIFRTEDSEEMMSHRDRTVWSIVTKTRCVRFFDGMLKVMAWLVRFHEYYYEPSSGAFDGHRFYKSMLTEDPSGSFTQQFAHSKMFRFFLKEKDAAKTVCRLHLDDTLQFHMIQKAKLYRALVGLTRGCWVWMVALDHTLDGDIIMDDLDTASKESGEWAYDERPRFGSLDFVESAGSGSPYISSLASQRRNSASLFGNSSVASASSGKSSHSQGAGGQWSSIFSSFGISSSNSNQALSKDAAVSRVSSDIQDMQLLLTLQERQWCRTDMQTFHESSSFFQTKPKKKWIYLEEKRIRYHFRKSKTREKGGIPLDPERTRLIVPVSHFDMRSESDTYERLQAALDRTRKPCPDELIEDPRPGSDDGHWIYLVTQMRDSNKARTIKLRFQDEMEERLWAEALRVKLMNSELLMRVLETAFTN